ncbi:nuclear transport factor 2 family protein [Rhodococcus rhodochrous]|uniref:nuclear transport factor 2 family protein n=1 Tax=Rhodococcus rhodochrous TaxID=1829 RepID=UPI001E466A10|nr:nuclear transport factor 2 family protein [Rhodococcus rhodochrous]MCB8913984.1 nuclear transport factor 2 family protein [Rhodococcus rhodochrous]
MSTSETWPKIADVVARYADYCDHGEWEKAARLFTQDGIFDAEAIFGQVVQGRPALAEFMSTRPAAVAHHPTTFYVDAVKDDEYHVRMKMLVLFNGAFSSIDYRWTMTEVGDEMQIRRQEIAMVGRVTTKASK